MAIYRAEEIKSAFGSSQEASDAGLAKEYQLCWVQSSNEWHFRTFLQYDLTKILYKTKIISAKLHVYDRWHNDNGANGTTNIARVTEEWEEDTLCWNLMPESTGFYLSESVYPPSVDSWSDWDVTALVREWVNHEYPNYGLMIVNNNEGEYRVDWQFYNRYYNNGQYATYIEIEYEPAEEVRITKTRMTEIADAIRAKKDTTAILSPAQMVAEIESIVIGDNLPNAEDAKFSSENEYAPGMLTTSPNIKSITNTNFQYIGYKFTANYDFGIYGFNHKAVSAKAFNLYLHDVTNNVEIAHVSYTATEASVWGKVMLEAPINIVKGNTYLVYADGGAYGSGGEPTYHSNITYVSTAYSGSRPPSSSGSYWSVVDILMGDVVTASKVTEYKIQTKTMDDIADEVKRITGATGTLSPAQIVTALQGIATQTTEVTE